MMQKYVVRVKRIGTALPENRLELFKFLPKTDSNRLLTKQKLVGFFIKKPGLEIIM